MEAGTGVILRIASETTYYDTGRKQWSVSWVWRQKGMNRLVTGVGEYLRQAQDDCEAKFINRMQSLLEQG